MEKKKKTFRHNSHILYLLEILEKCSSHHAYKNDELTSNIDIKKIIYKDEYINTILFYHYTEVNFISGIYWILGSLALLEKNYFDIIPSNIKDLILAMIEKCHCERTGGYKMSYISASSNGILATLYAIQCYKLLKCEKVDYTRILNYVLSLQDNTTGAFKSSSVGWKNDLSIRNCLCALIIIRYCQHQLFNKVEEEEKEEGLTSNSNISKLLYGRYPISYYFKKLINWIILCQNIDGGFGSSPGVESHPGYTYCALACLKILDSISLLMVSKSLYIQLCWFLASRMSLNNIPPSCTLCEVEDILNKYSVLPNIVEISPVYVSGRPGKQADVCYSWWVLASAIIVCEISESMNINPFDIFLKSCIEVNKSIRKKSTGKTSLFFINKEKLINAIIQGILHFQNSSGGFSKFVPITIPSLNHVNEDHSSHEISETYDTDFKSDVYHSFFSIASISLLKHYCEDHMDKNQISSPGHIDISTGFLLRDNSD